MRKKTTAVVLAVLVFSLIAASAASLGGITTADIGAEVDVVASCDTDGVTVSFGTTFDGTEYVVDSVTVSGIDAPCIGQDLSVTLSGLVGPDVEVGPQAVAGASETIAVPDYSAEDLNGVAVLITG